MQVRASPPPQSGQTLVYFDIPGVRGVEFGLSQRVNGVFEFAGTASGDCQFKGQRLMGSDGLVEMGKRGFHAVKTL